MLGGRRWSIRSQRCRRLNFDQSILGVDLDNIGTKEIMQICLVVRDAEKTWGNFRKVFGIDDAVLKEVPKPDAMKAYYHGKVIDTNSNYNAVDTMGSLGCMLNVKMQK